MRLACTFKQQISSLRYSTTSPNWLEIQINPGLAYSEKLPQIVATAVKDPVAKNAVALKAIERKVAASQHEPVIGVDNAPGIERCANFGQFGKGINPVEDALDDALCRTRIAAIDSQESSNIIQVAYCAR